MSNTHASQANASAELSALMYEIAGIPNLKNKTLNDIFRDGNPYGIDNFDVLRNIMQTNKLGEVQIVDTSWSHGNQYGTDGVDAKSMKAATFLFPNGDVYVAYRGTGHYNWDENAYAYGLEKSRMEKWAAEYFDQTIANYYEGQTRNNLYVTGHSQGGHNAQYATLFARYASYITNCYSIDGLGFSKEVIEEAKRLYGDAYYELQLLKMFAFNGQYDYANHQGEVVIIPDSRTTTIFTNLEGVKVNNIIEALHSIFYMIDDSGFCRIGEEKETSKLIGLLVVELNKLQQPQKFEAMQVFFKFVENIIGSGSVGVPVNITTEEFLILKNALIPILVELIDKNPEMISDVLIELSGMEQAMAESIRDLLEHINTYPPEVREQMLQAILGIINYENGQFSFNWSQVPEAILTAWPVILETLLTHPDDIGTILHELGIDTAIREWIKENPWQFVGICIGAVILAPIWFPIAKVTVIAGLLADAVIRIVQGLTWLVDLLFVSAAVDILVKIGAIIGDKLADLYAAIKNGIIDFVIGSKDFIEKIGVAIGNFISDTILNIKKWVDDFTVAIKDWIQQGIETLKTEVAVFFDKIRATIDDAKTFINNVCNGLTNFVNNAVSQVKDFVSGTVDTVTNIVGDVVAGVTFQFENIKNAVKNIFENIQGFWESAKEKFHDFANWFVDSLPKPGDTQSGIERTVDKIDEIVKNLQAYVQSFADKCLDLTANVNHEFGQIQVGFTTAFNGIQKYAVKDRNFHGSNAPDVGGGSSGIAYSNVSGSKIAVDLYELRSLKTTAEELLNEIKRHTPIIARAKSVTSEAMAEHNQTYVQSDGRNVLNICSQTERDETVVKHELTDLINGIGKAINDYLGLERELI